ncbi:hypothetical protein HK097_004832, partial [Rhizophlyctis rosea]
MISQTHKDEPENQSPSAAPPAQLLHSFPLLEYLTIILAGCILTLSCGLLNAIALTGYFATSVSHMTGHVALLSLAIAKGDYSSAYHLAAVIAAFMVGAFLSGAIVGGETFMLSRRYGVVLLIESISLVGAYGFHRVKADVGTYFAGFACGLQNAMATTYSGAIIRTTHVTGTTTDIALIL